MKFKGLILFFISMLLTQSAWSSNRFQIFTALSVGAKRTSNMDIEDYIEATRIQPDVKMRLFELADRDWEKYQNLLETQHNAHYDDALKELAYAQLLEHDATKKIGRSSEERQSFLTTEREYFEELQKRESEAVREYLDQRLGIVEGRKRFGQDLIDQGFPHRSGETAEEVYWRWYEDQKQIVREEFRKREVLRHEYVEATRYNRELRLRPTAVYDLKQELDSIIDDQLHGQRLELAQVRGVLSSHPALKHRISDLHLISLEEVSMAKIKELDEAEFNRYLSKIRRTLPDLRKKDFLDRLKRYEQVSATLAQKYKNATDLEELSEKSLNKFVEGGTYNDFMMARLYSIASGLVEKDVNREKVTGSLIHSVQQALPELLDRLSSARTYQKEENQSLLFENVVASELREILGASKLKGHLKQLTDMAIWVVKFEAKKMSLESTTKVIVEKTSYDTFEGHKKLSDYLKKQEYLKGLKKYRDNRLSRISYLLQIKTKEGRRLRDHQAYQYIVGRQ